MKSVSERAVVFVIAAVQFVNIVDFVMVMPLGPFYAGSLGITAARLGWIAGSYTTAAALSGLAGSLFLDRFDRRKVLAIAMFGLVAGTIAGGFATSFETMILARVIAGMFGGPATSISFSIIADVVPSERRGKAMGSVMAAFSVAAIVGVPAALQLAEWGGWRLPFFVVGGMGAALVIAAIYVLPPMRRHLEAGPTQGLQSYAFLRRPLVWLSYLMTAVTMASGFILIPNIPAYILGNLHYPKEHFAILYASGGVASFIVLKIAGVLVDRHGSFRVGTLGVVMLIATVYVGFVDYPGLWIPLLYVMFMSAMGFRNVAYNTLTSKVPRPQERARFMSLQSAVQHAASGSGAFISALMMTTRGEALVGIDRVGWTSIALSTVLPGLLWTVERAVRRKALTDTPPAAAVQKA